MREELLLFHRCRWNSKLTSPHRWYKADGNVCLLRLTSTCADWKISCYIFHVDVLEPGKLQGFEHLSSYIVWSTTIPSSILSNFQNIRNEYEHKRVCDICMKILRKSIKFKAFYFVSRSIELNRLDCLTFKCLITWREHCKWEHLTWYRYV